MIPYHDENRTLRTPIVTLAILGLNVASWLLVQGAGTPAALARSVCDYGLIAGELTGMVAPGTEFPIGPDMICATDPGRGVLHLLTSMFLHGSWMHLIGNLWFLWIFGNNVEDAMGRLRFLVFYPLTGLAAAGAQVALTPASPVPMVGASGAISGVMGAYLLLYPTVRVWTLVPLGFFFTSVALPAWTMLVYWLALQFLSGVLTLGGESVGGVAFWAHVGGFVAGLALVKIFARSEYLREHRRSHWEPRRTGWRER